MPTTTAASARRRAAPPPRPPAQRHVATITHHAPFGDALALITCTCRQLRTAVDADDPDACDFVLWEHLDRHVDDDHLLIDDTRTGRLSTISHAATPDLLLILNPPRKDNP